MDKYTFAIIGILSMVALQCVAWYFGKDGQVFALTSSIIVGLIAFVTGIAISFKKQN